MSYADLSCKKIGQERMAAQAVRVDFLFLAPTSFFIPSLLSTSKRIIKTKCYSNEYFQGEQIYFLQDSKIQLVMLELWQLLCILECSLMEDGKY